MVSGLEDTLQQLIEQEPQDIAVKRREPISESIRGLMFCWTFYSTPDVFTA